MVGTTPHPTTRARSAIRGLTSFPSSALTQAPPLKLEVKVGPSWSAAFRLPQDTSAHNQGQVTVHAKQFDLAALPPTTATRLVSPILRKVSLLKLSFLIFLSFFFILSS